MIAFLKAHKRAIVPGLALAWTAFQLIHPDVWGRLVDVSFFALFLLIIGSQFFWFGRHGPRVPPLYVRLLSVHRRSWSRAVLGRTSAEASRGMGELVKGGVRERKRVSSPLPPPEALQ
jgi:hypothetical protein